MARVPGYESGARMTRAQMRSPDSFEALDIAGRELMAYGIEKQQQAEEDQNIAMATDLANADLELKRRMADMGQNTYDVSSGKFYDMDGNELDGDLVSQAGNIYKDVMSPVLAKYGDRIPPEVRASGQAKYQANAINVNSQVRSIGIADNYTKQTENYYQSVKTGEMSTEDAWAALEGLAFAYPLDDKVRRSLLDQTRSGLLMVDFDTLFQKDKLAAIDKLQDGGYAELGEQQEAQLWSDARRYTANEIKKQAEAANERLNYGLPVNIDTSVTTLAAKMGMEEQAKGLTELQILSDKAAMFSSSTVGDNQARLDQLWLEGYQQQDPDKLKEHQFLSKILQAKQEQIKSDPYMWASQNGYDVGDFVGYNDDKQTFVDQRRDLRAEIAEKQGMSLSSIPLLGKREASGIVAGIMSLPPDQRSLEFGDFASLFSDKELAGVANEVSAISSNVAAALTIRQYNPKVTEYLLTADQLPQDLPKVDKGLFNEKFQSTFDNEFVTSSGARDVAYDAVMAVYTRMAWERGELGDTSVDPDIFQEAMNAVVGQPFKTPGDKKTFGYRGADGEFVPTDDITDALEWLSGKPEMYPEIYTEQGDTATTIQQVVNKGSWIPVGGENGKYTVMSPTGGYYSDINGSPIVFDMAEIVAGYKSERMSWARDSYMGDPEADQPFWRGWFD